jgi:hypothetical protein
MNSLMGPRTVIEDIKLELQRIYLAVSLCVFLVFTFL